MADAISRVASGRSIGAFACSTAPARKTPWAASRDAFGESVPCWSCRWAMRGGLPISTELQFQPAMKAFPESTEPINIAAEVGNIFHTAFTK